MYENVCVCVFDVWTAGCKIMLSSALRKENGTVYEAHDIDRYTIRS